MSLVTVAIFVNKGYNSPLNTQKFKGMLNGE